MADLVEAFDLGRLGRAFGHHQSPDRFHVPVAGLGRPQLPFTLSCSSGLDGVDHVGLALAASLLAVRAVHLDHLDTGPAQVAGQRGPVRTGALHPHLGERTEGPQPPQQRLIASRGGRELLHPQQATHPIQSGGHVQVQVSVHAASHPARGIYHCQRHPCLSLFGSGWRSRFVRHGGSSCCCRAIRHTQTAAPPPGTWPTNRSQDKPADRQPVLKPNQTQAS